MTDYLHRDPTRRDELLTIEQVADLIERFSDDTGIGSTREETEMFARAVRVHHWAAAALLAPGRPGLARRAARVHRARCRLSSPQRARLVALGRGDRATASP